MTTIKICGIKTTEHAIVAAQAGADMIGVAFMSSRRQITNEQAAMIRAALNTLERPPKLVGLFVNATAEAIQSTIDQCGLDYLQLSGDEPAEVLTSLPELPILKSFRMNGTTQEQQWLAIAQRNKRVTLLVDAHVAGSYGGTGVVADWVAAAQLARQVPILLAGGLNPANVASAIRTVRPWGVDVSSGVETHGSKNGSKDSAKIQAFIAAARSVALE
jgi:phosphoribosylanthranilate isomerase